MKNTGKRNKALVAALFLAVVAAGCVEDMDDVSMAEIKKPEIISVVVDPPEAAPGETVRASFLLADGDGPIVDTAGIWIPMPATSEELDTVAALEMMGMTVDDLAGSSVEYTVPDQGDLVFGDDGFSAVILMMGAAVGDDPSPDTAAMELLAGFEGYVDDGRMKMAQRTALVSTRENRNENPAVLSVTSGTETVQGDALTIVHHDDPDLAAARQAAADNPLVVKAEAELYFEVAVEDDGDPEETLRYQWIATGGSFDGYRERLEPWTAPERLPLEEGDRDQEGETGVDPRTDPNLHTVWVILRDNGVDGQLGQAWAEFYVRVVP